MAAIATRTRNVSAANTNNLEPASSWRLPPMRLQEIRDVAQGVEETNAGICTRYLLDELERAGPPGEDSIAMFDAERFCDEYAVLGHASVQGWRSRILRCRRALRSLVDDALPPSRRDHEAVGVLHVAYGHPDPIVREWPNNALEFLGPELAPLVRYVQATEQVRLDLVRSEVMIRRSIHRPGDGEVIDVVDLGRHRGTDRWLDRVVSSGDAIRHVMGEPHVPQRPGEEREAWNRRRQARKDAHAAKRTSFLVQAKYEADMMLTRASVRYHEAWRATK